MTRGLFARLCLLLTLCVSATAAAADADGRFVPQGPSSVLDRATGLTWQAGDDGVARNWEEALAWCSELALDDHTDWRLPDIKELRSIVDTTRQSPALDPQAFPDARSQGYWTSSTRASSPNFAWYVIFARGQVYTNIKTETAYVRCVR